MLPGNTRHETIGSDILAVLRTIKQPEELLGANWVSRLREINAGGWYPIDTLLELEGELIRKGGQATLVQLGRQLFRDCLQKRLTPRLRSAGDVFFSIDGMYRGANRGQDIGGWEVLCFSPGHARLRTTTPHHCAVQEGLLHEGLKCVGAVASIAQPRCREAGAPCCEFELRSSAQDSRWMGTYSPLEAASA